MQSSQNQNEASGYSTISSYFPPQSPSLFSISSHNVECSQTSQASSPSMPSYRQDINQYDAPTQTDRLTRDALEQNQLLDDFNNGTYDARQQYIYGMNIQDASVQSNTSNEDNQDLATMTPLARYEYEVVLLYHRYNDYNPAPEFSYDSTIRQDTPMDHLDEVQDDLPSDVTTLSLVDGAVNSDAVYYYDDTERMPSVMMTGKEEIIGFGAQFDAFLSGERDDPLYMNGDDLPVGHVWT